MTKIIKINIKFYFIFLKILIKFQLNYNLKFLEIQVIKFYLEQTILTINKLLDIFVIEFHLKQTILMIDESIAIYYKENIDI